ncbi:MAG: YhcH/YjgK/YiaL family protein [Kiritimatiellales bacterium]
MLHDHNEYLSRSPLPEEICRKIVAFVKNASELAPGKYEIDRERVYASISCYTTTAGKDSSFEAHQKYADLHLVLQGEEQVAVVLNDRLPVKALYDGTGDSTLYEPGTTIYSSVVLQPGYFVLLLPNELHMPGIATENPAPVTKVIIKIAKELLNSQKTNPVTAIQL